MAMMTAAGSKLQTAHDDTAEFIRGLELTARKILTKANKRRMAELHRQQCMAKRNGTPVDANGPHKFVVEIPEGVEEWGDQLASRKMEIASTGMTAGVKATRDRTARPALDGIGATSSSLPSLGGSGTQGMDVSEGGGSLSNPRRKLPHITRTAGMLTFGAPLKVSDDHGVVGAGGVRAGRTAAPVAKIDDRLTISPLFSASMMELTKAPKDSAAAVNDPLSGEGAEDDEEAAGGIANMRVVNASKIVGAHGTGRPGGGGGRATYKRAKGGRGSGGGAQIEGQGVTSWSSDDLRVKYRSEREREEAYQAFRLEEQVAEALQQDYGQAVAVPEVSRHPLYVAYYVQLERENTRCLLRASARNKMKRFITDVHTVWLTNLSHHPEFRRMVGVSGYEGGGGSDLSVERGDAGEDVDGGIGPSVVTGDNESGATVCKKRRGLDGGRDSAAIASSKSQIQSVQPERAFRGALFYRPTSGSRSSNINDDGKNTTHAASIKSPRASSTSATASVPETLIGTSTEGGESPELPPPPPPRPTLSVLASDRRRLASWSAPVRGARRSLGRSGDGRKTVDGADGGSRGRKRSSVGGVSGVRSPTTWLDVCTRILRVVRFAPASQPLRSLPAPTQALLATTTNAPALGAPDVIGGGDLGHESLRHEGEQQPAAACSTHAPGTWMISSFHPRDASETRAFLSDETVARVVNQALTSPGPIVDAGKSDARYQEKARVGPPTRRGQNAGSREERGGAGDRKLVLRKGARVPVSGRNDGGAGKILSVVEVFASLCAPLPGASGTMEKGNSKDAEAAAAATTAVIAAENVVLEVVAFPVGFESQPHGLPIGRQRVAITSQSLWQRRRCLPQENAFPPDTPSTWLADWWGDTVRRERSPSDVKDGSSKHYNVAGSGVGQQLGEGEETGKASCHGSETGISRARVALDDLVEMLAFGPPPLPVAASASLCGSDPDPIPQATGRSPLLLRGIEHLLREKRSSTELLTAVAKVAAETTGTVMPKAATATKGNKASKASPAEASRTFAGPSLTRKTTPLKSAASCATTAMPPEEVTRIQNESRAEVLLSLVRLSAGVNGSGGEGGATEITVDGVPSSSMLDDVHQAQVETWEEEADRVDPLSLQVSGRRHRTQEVPGTCNIGTMGTTFSYPQATERTQAVASFFRDASLSSTNSVMVVTALALDTPRLSPLVIAWDRQAEEPEPAPDEDALGVVPRVMISSARVIGEGVATSLGSTVAPDALILTSAEQPADHMAESLTILTGKGQGKPGQVRAITGVDDDGSGQGSRNSGPGDGDIVQAGGEEARGAAREPSRRGGTRHRRGWDEVDGRGFRRYAVYQLLEPSGFTQPLGFGVTERAALPNTAAVCGRSTFHSEQRCMEQLCRQRTAKDYAYVSANTDHCGPSDPGNYSVSCKHERMKSLLRTGLELYNAEVVRIAVERERQAKDAALQAKVEIGKAQLASRRAREDAAARSLLRKADAQNLKISAGENRSRRKWEMRVQESHVLETRGSWEQRRDTSGSTFYYCSTEAGLPQPFRWDPPDEWDKHEPSATLSGGSGCGEGNSSTDDGARAHGSQPELSSLTSTANAAIRQFVDDDVAVAASNEEHILPRHYTEEEKVSLAVTRLAENEQLLQALAWRLGIPLADIRPNGREPALSRKGSHTKPDGEEGENSSENDEEKEENREQIELGMLDDASDSDCERGDERGPPGALPQDHSDLRRIRVAERRRKLKADKGIGHEQPHHSIVPPLAIAEVPPYDGRESRGSAIPLPAKGVPAVESLEAQIKGLGWRRLARANVGEKFMDRVVNPRMQGPRPEAVNTRPKPRPTGTVDPTQATKRTEDFFVPVECMFISDVVEEHARVLQEAERRMRREEILGGDDASAGFNAAAFAANGPQEFTTMERRLMAMADEDGRGKGEKRGDESKAKAIIAAKTGNIADLEGLLYEDVPPDTKDSNGNSLLLLAAQQGNKRIVKFLLRKGATMNVQNMDGNTVLHFCFSSGRQDLAEYLMSKGADDSLLNSEGLTCYEGLQAQRLDNI